MENRKEIGGGGKSTEGGERWGRGGKENGGKREGRWRGKGVGRKTYGDFRGFEYKRWNVSFAQTDCDLGLYARGEGGGESVTGAEFGKEEDSFLDFRYMSATL